MVVQGFWRYCQQSTHSVPRKVSLQQKRRLRLLRQIDDDDRCLDIGLVPASLQTRECSTGSVASQSYWSPTGRPTCAAQVVHVHSVSRASRQLRLDIGILLTSAFCKYTIYFDSSAFLLSVPDLLEQTAPAELTNRYSYELSGCNGNAALQSCIWQAASV